VKLELGAYERLHRETLEKLLKDRAVERIWNRDAGFWKAEEAHRKIIANALGWLDVADRLSASAAELPAFVEGLRGDTDGVLVLGMGGSSLAPLVFADSFRRQEGWPQVEILDSTEPSMVVGAASRHDPKRTIYIVSSKSGTTLEPNIFFDYFYDAAQKVLAGRAGERFLVITDPGSALETLAKTRRVRRVFPGDPQIGGRYSALSFFGLVPAAFAGVDVSELLKRARAMAVLCHREAPGNPGAILGTALGTLALKGRDKLTFSVGPPIPRLGMWIEQLVAESTGKEGAGILPVEGEGLGAPGVYGPDRFFVAIGRERNRENMRQALSPLAAAGHPYAIYEIQGAEDLGAEMFRWEFATAVAGHLLGIDPFDQPNVQEAKDRTNEILSGKAPAAAPAAGPIDGKAVAALLASLKERDYFAMTAYVPSTPENEEALNRTRLRIRDARRVATTLGFGPRFLHSTGQLHKGGPDTGVFLQVTAEPSVSAAIPERPWGFGDVVAAQAAGDLAALKSRGRRALRVHLGRDLAAGLASLDAAVASALSAAGS
jgi:transaldolase/glucose-6-phosphate isomerase